MWLFQNAITDLVLAFGFTFALVASLAGFPRAVRPTCLATLALFCVGEAVVAIGYEDQSDWRNSVLAVFQLLPTLAFTAGIAFFEARVVRVLLVYSALWVGPQASHVACGCDMHGGYLGEKSTAGSLAL